MVDLPAELIEKIIQSLAAQTNTIVSQQIHDGITLLAEPSTISLCSIFIQKIECEIVCVRVKEL
jgi:hypothetical protein